MGQSPSLQSVIFLPAIESSIIAVMELLRRWSWQIEGVNNGCAKGWRCSQAFLFILSGVERGQISTHRMGENGMNLCNWLRFVFRFWCVLIISCSKKGEKNCVGRTWRSPRLLSGELKSRTRTVSPSERPFSIRSLCFYHQIHAVPLNGICHSIGSNLSRSTAHYIRSVLSQASRFTLLSRSVSKWQFHFLLVFLYTFRHRHWWPNCAGNPRSKCYMSLFYILQGAFFFSQGCFAWKAWLPRAALLLIRLPNAALFFSGMTRNHSPSCNRTDTLLHVLET